MFLLTFLCSLVSVSFAVDTGPIQHQDKAYCVDIFDVDHVTLTDISTAESVMDYVNTVSIGVAEHVFHDIKIPDHQYRQSGYWNSCQPHKTYKNTDRLNFLPDIRYLPKV